MPPTRVDVLIDGLLHDARNPLNALSIHLDVLVERLKREVSDPIPESLDRHLRPMREQITRIDGQLKLFGDFLSPREGSDPLEAPELLAGAVQVLGCFSRRRRVPIVVQHVEAVRLPGSPALQPLLVELLFRVLMQGQPGQSVVASIRADAHGATVTASLEGDGGPGGEFELSTLEGLVSDNDATLLVGPRELTVRLRHA